MSVSPSSHGIINNTHNLTSQALSWLQKGQVNCVSKGIIAFLFGGGLLAFFLLPIGTMYDNTGGRVFWNLLQIIFSLL